MADGGGSFARYTRDPKQRSSGIDVVEVVGLILRRETQEERDAMG